MKIKVVGAGGIGTALLLPLSRYLNFNEETVTVTIIDGDSYEDKNQERQNFHRLGNKAEVASEKLKEEFPRVAFKFRPEYLTTTSVEYLLEDNDIIFLCVDNHATRKLVSDYCEQLDEVSLISGGNDYTDGNIQVYLKSAGKNLTSPIANSFHPEIVKPRDRNPADLGCGELIASEPQLIFTNFMIAALMLNAFYAYLQGEVDYDEVYADILTNNCRAVVRRQVVNAS